MQESGSGAINKTKKAMQSIPTLLSFYLQSLIVLNLTIVSLVKENILPMQHSEFYFFLPQSSVFKNLILWARLQPKPASKQAAPYK
jgi:hypothetical protein